MDTGSNTIQKLLTPDELADFLQISKTTVYRIIDKRLIPFYKIKGCLRFDLNDVLAYLQKNRIEPVKDKIYAGEKN